MRGKRLGRFARDDRARGAAIEHEAGDEIGAKIRASSISFSISPDAQPSNGEGCAGTRTRSLASSAERNSAATLGGPSMTT